MDFAKGFKRGDEVDITTEELDKKHTISFIKRTGGVSHATDVVTAALNQEGGVAMMYKAVCSVCHKDCEVPFKPRSEAGITCKACFNASRGISPASASSGPIASRSSDINESIKRQAIGNMTSRAMISLQGQVNETNIHETVKALYKTFQDLVG